ncbi:Uncharacterised protein [Chlamydia trachomatis]|nr:Uncharacterised protein [Chlamydia trachomatis]
MLGIHVLHPDILLDTTDEDTRLVFIHDTILYTPRAEIAVGDTWEADGHGIVAILHTTDRYLGKVARLVRLIIGRVVGWLIALTGVDTEYGEVIGMARPHPVVGIGTKLTHRCRWSEYHTDVGENVVYH